MSEVVNRKSVWLCGITALVFWLAPAAAEMAKVRLKDGTVMRGDVELTESEAVIHNAAGEARYQRERIDQIEWLEAARTVQSDYLRRFWGLAPDDVEGHFGLAQRLAERRVFEPARQQCRYVLKLAPDHQDAKLLLQRVEQSLAGAEAPTPPAGEETKPGAAEDGAEQEEGRPARQRYQGPEPSPLLSPRDILKLKLSEVELDGPAERLNVRFRKVRGERDLEDLVRAEMAEAVDYDPDWARTLERGQPYEKLPVILKATGLKYADRLEIRGDPRAFATYRRRVLPRVIKGCVRSGCHGGYTTHAFRFPIGSQTSDEFVYTSFAILDEMGTAAGPMIDRALPEESALLRYMLPGEEGRQAHPSVKQGRITPVLRGTRDHRYQAIVEWISSLRSPHPDYELEYKFPAWFEPLSRRQRRPAILGEQSAEAAPQEKPAEDDPGQPKPDDGVGVADNQKPDGAGGAADDKPDDGGGTERP